MRRIWRAVLDRITPYEPGPPMEALAAELGITDLVRLSANENPLGPPPSVVAAIQREAARVHLYPDGGARVLREAIARRIGVARDQIVMGNGADELLGLIAGAAFEPGDEVIVPQPSFEPYTILVDLAGATIVGSPLVKYEQDLDDIRRRVTDRTKAIMICSPHNPATTIVRRAPLVAFLDALGPDGPLVVLDEAYRDFCDDPDYPDGVALLRRYPRLVVLRTFSKIAGLAGLRVGYAVGPAETIDRLNRVRAPYNVNRLGQVAALAALEDEPYRARTRAVVLEERTFLSAELARRGYAFPPSQANFLLVHVPGARDVSQRLLRGGIIVRVGAAIGYPEHLRIAIGVREVNRRLLSLLDAPA
ncbi:MAG: histidinol-phosphate transaminase [Candidatus Rokubacteria bacterium]|nr:histidinol-phosphate transaminase [Candidatus Rokubacteria bacterium]